MLNIYAEIKNVKYTPTLGGYLDLISLEALPQALSSKASFRLQVDEQNIFAISRWVSPKRTRSYPYSRVYDTLQFSGKRITIIPIIKDEGKHGDRDFLQWDTVSLMSLLGIYVIIGYYAYADINQREIERPKLTNQQFELSRILQKIQEIKSYQWDALHWNLAQLEEVGMIGDLALSAYQKLGEELNIPMHSEKSAIRKVNILKQGAETFKDKSRQQAASAANREIQTINPKEYVSGQKGRIIIRNYLGGQYHLTVDEVWVQEPNILKLIEAKHTTIVDKLLTSDSDIKDGLFKMILFTNLENVRIGENYYKVEAGLKLSSLSEFNPKLLPINKQLLYRNLLSEAAINNFKVIHITLV